MYVAATAAKHWLPSSECEFAGAAPVQDSWLDRSFAPKCCKRFHVDCAGLPVQDLNAWFSRSFCPRFGRRIAVYA